MDKKIFLKNSQKPMITSIICKMLFSHRIIDNFQQTLKFSVWLRNGFNAANINRFRSNTGKGLNFVK